MLDLWLRTDYVDLYWVHLWDRHTPLEETMRALDDAVRTGKILYVGISDAPAWVVARANTLAEWRGWTPFAGLQVPYNLLNRDIERELLPMAETLGMTVATWGPLAHGVLSGKFTPSAGPEAGTRTALESSGAREHTAARAVREVADEMGSTPAQVAIAWTRACSQAVHPILGARTAEQLKDNLGALDVTLPDDALRRLEAAVEFTVGFPGDFIAKASPAVFGEVSARLDGR
jgi:aryl-alcohol dehydrogenase-like predicted oxidoreductase